MTIHYFNQFADGDDMSGFDVAFLQQLRGQRDKLIENLENAAAAQYNLTPEPYGGFRRTLAAHLAIPSSGATVYVLDDSIDWRDRMLMIATPASFGGSSSPYPGHADDIEINTTTASGFFQARCYYTGTGYADPGGAPSNEYHKLHGADEVQIYASISGELRIEIESTAGSGTFQLLGMVFAGPKMGARGATVGQTYVTTAALYDAVDAGLVEPHDLNNLQDGLHLGQMQGADSFPLGAVGRGDPSLPYEWTVRGATVRQRLTEPALRRYVSATLASDETILLDSSFDWRDRMVWAAGMFSITVDRRPGEAGDSGGGTNQNADCSTTYFAGYTGDGDTDANHTGSTERRYTLRHLAPAPVSPVFLYADASTGYLYASTKDSAPSAALTLDLIIMGSPRIGPRSKGVGPDKLDADLPGAKVVGTLVDSASSDVTNIVARWRFDRGLVVDGTKLAVIADQTGNGHHLRQLDPDLRAPVPVARALLNNAVGSLFTGTEYYETVKALPASLVGFHVAAIIEPTAITATFDFWRALLPLATEGDIRGLITAAVPAATWKPNATATPDYEYADTSAVYAAATGLGIAWNFPIDGGDAARLQPDVTVFPAGGAPSSAVLVSTSPAGVGAADVQSLVWRFGEGFAGYICEIVVADAAQTSVDDFLSSADILSRYGL